MKEIELLNTFDPKTFIFKTFELIGPNEKGRDFFVGDIHGTFHVLDQAIKAIGFDKTKDRLFCTGDLFDRGPFEHRVMEFLGQPWFFCIMGNHDQFMVSRFLMVHEKMEHIRRKIDNPEIPDDELDRKAKTIFKDNVFSLYYPFVTKMNVDDFEAMLYHLVNLPTIMEVAGYDGNIGMVHAEMMAGLTWEDFVSYALGMEEISAKEHDTLLDCIRWGGRIPPERLASNYVPYFHVLYPTKEDVNGDEVEHNHKPITHDDIKKTACDMKLVFSGHNIMPVEDKSFFKDAMRTRLNNSFDNMVFIDHGSFVAHSGEMATDAFGLGIYDDDGRCILLLDSEKL